MGSDVWDKVPNKYVFFDTFPKWSRSVLECSLSPTSLSLCMKITCHYMNRPLFLLHQDPINVLCMKSFCPLLIFFRIEQRFGEGEEWGCEKGEKTINTHL